ncbi:hypothetical protein OSB04_012002 [Centaurea solstitialis]|uniref:Uncharacterized protein n=1 Tax=Centaurea solstitialis TaxID=347529 RepID=A0AA38TI42_9ASTR|nr:hypothetical protein OSB04_012002 [Centaurea solstitialis]
MEEHQRDDLPESLEIHILIFLDAKKVVQTSQTNGKHFVNNFRRSIRGQEEWRNTNVMTCRNLWRFISSLFSTSKKSFKHRLLSKPWISLCTSMLFLHLNPIAFHKLGAFNKFFHNVLCFRDQPTKFNTLSFTRGGLSNGKDLKSVPNYAFSHGANHLELFIQNSSSGSWPICQYTASDSLKTLILKSERMFENLAVLHLKRAIISNLEPFLGFPGWRDWCSMT